MTSAKPTFFSNVPREAAMAATGIDKPMKMISEMRDAKFRPIVRTLSDVIDVMDQAGLKPITSIRGRAIPLRWHGGTLGALSWVQGETENEQFRIAIPTSNWITGIDQDDRYRELPIAKFNGGTVLKDGSLRLKMNSVLRRVAFSVCRLAFELTPTQEAIGGLVSKYLNLSGANLPTEYLDYLGLLEMEVTSLRSVTDFVRSHWRDEGWQDDPPSRETIATTLEVIGMRDRVRPLK